MKLASVHALNDPNHDPTAMAGDPFALARRLRAPVWVYDIDRACVAYANAAACELWQAESEADLCARPMQEGMSATVAKRLKQYQADFEQHDATFTEMWTLYPNGVPTSVMVVFGGFRLPDGRMAMLCEAMTDAQDEPQNVRSAEALLHTDVMIALYSKDGPALYANPAARNVLTAPDARFSDAFVDAADYADLLIGLNASGEHRMVCEVTTAAGTRWHDVSAKSCSDAATGKPAILVTAIDVTELKRARDTARFLADRDQLTGCFNRSYMQSQFAELSSRTGRRCALVFFDLDRFKQINDRHGHEAGDTVLKDVASRTRTILREGDIMARLGGDEFVVLFDDIKSADDVDHRITALRHAVAVPIIHDTTRIDATISMGVAPFAAGSADFEEIMRQADIALYASKQAGRNCATFFSEDMGKAVAERHLLEEELKVALQYNQFVLYYQPRVDLRSGRVVSVEGLVRWQHPTRGLVPPDVFIPICEETGMIEELGRQVLEMGGAQACTWRRAGWDLDVSLNISPRQFNDGSLLKVLGGLSNAPDFPRGQVELEITENVLFGDHQSIAEKLRTITGMGYPIAIDDFGTGYSNLSYISRFPLKCLKIDRSFVDQLPASGPIISLILTLARQIGATVVAEGVETAAQLDWLRGQECDQAQGYHLSRPVPVDELEDVINGLAAQAANTPR